MILRRLARGAREYDWFTVAVELGIVVIGIFLGLQVDDWNTGRVERAQERTYVDLLHTDVEMMLADLSEDARDAAERRRTMLTALRAIQARDESPDARMAVERSFFMYQTAAQVTYRDATYSEMVSSGALARIEDVELKQKIISTFSFLGLVNESIAQYRISLAAVDQIVWRNVSYRIGDDADDLTVSFDIGELSQNPQVGNAFTEMIDIQSDRRGIIVDAIDELTELSAMLDAQDPG